MGAVMASSSLQGEVKVRREGWAEGWVRIAVLSLT